MALDGVVMFVVSPFGLVAYALGLGIMMLTWRAILGQRFGTIGFRPLLAGLAVSIIATLLLTAVLSSIAYAERLATYPGLGGFWTIVPGWTLYLYSVYAVMLFFLFVLVLVPFAALLIRHNRLSWKTIMLAVLVGWLLASVTFGGFPANEWQQAHRLEYLLGTTLSLAWVFWLIFGPFLGAIRMTMRQWPRRPRMRPEAT